MTAQVIPLTKNQIEIVQATGRAIARQRNEIDDELQRALAGGTGLHGEVAALREIVNSLPNGSQVATALTASRLLGKRYLAEARRGLEQLGGVADNMGVDGDDIDQDQYIDRIESQVRAAIAEWHLVKSISPNTSLRMKDGTKPNLAGGRKLSDHLRISLLRTREHLLGGDPTEIVVRGHGVQMPRPV